MNYYLLLGLGVFGLFILILLFNFRNQIISMNPFSLQAVRSHKNITKMTDQRLVKHYENNIGEVSWNNKSLSKKQRLELISTLDGYREEDERLRDRMIEDYNRQTNLPDNEWQPKKKTEIDYNDDKKPIRRTIFEKASAPISIFSLKSPRRMNKKSQIAFMKNSLRNSDEFKDVDIDSIDFEHDFDSSLSYSENYANLSKNYARTTVSQRRRPRHKKLSKAEETKYRNQQIRENRIYNAEERFFSQSDKKIKADGRRQAKKTQEPEEMTDKQFKAWIKKPNTSDIKEIDTKDNEEMLLFRKRINKEK